MISKKKSLFDYFNYIIITLITLVMLYPFLYVFSVSVSDNASVMSGSITFYPKNINFNAYRDLMAQSQFWTGYKNTIIYTTLSTLAGLFITVICAYPLSKKDLPGRATIIKFFAITMFFTGGLIPQYLLVKSLGWVDSILAIVVPGALQVYYIIIARTFFEGIPSDLDDAGAIDGLNDIGIMLRIYLPLSKPVLATVGLYFAVNAWNAWFNALIYLNDPAKLPVMIFLRNIVNGAEIAANNPEMAEIETVASPVMRSATIVAVIIPIICVYPFIQKYFVKGLMVGSVKG